MEQTRVRILDDIVTWIKDPESLQICWITGMAGTGKTSIAKTICERASTDKDVILGGSFFCSRTGVAAQRDIRYVVPTLVQLLARQSIEFCRALAVEIEPHVQYKEVATQVEQLLYNPLLALKNSRTPILFVIDALDECGGSTADNMLDDAKGHRIVSAVLEALVNFSRSSVKLPVKFLITSRPEAQIRDTSISDDRLSKILRLHAVTATDIHDDITHYITQTLTVKLSGKPGLEAEISKNDIEQLVRFCDGLFIVAATALKHIFSAGADAAEERFTKLLNASGESLNPRAAAPLDLMYKLILDGATREDDPEATELQALLKLLASILSTRMSLSIAALADLLALKPFQVRASLSLLHAVVYVPEDNDTPGLRTVHASFGDYLLSRAPSHIRISQSLGHDTLAPSCLNLMRSRLRFNISQSHSSYERNPSTRPDNISLSLEYACMHWAHHAAAVSNLHEYNTSSPSTIDIEIDQKFRPNLLFWLEVLSVLHKVGLASGLLLIAVSAVGCLPAALVRLLTLSQVQDHDVAQFLRDAHSFVASSYEAIERSAPHIYLSALPFADKSSLVFKSFSPYLTGLITVETFGIDRHGGRAYMTLAGHSAAVRSVSYSPDGLLLASGSSDGSVRVWSTRTGEEALAPLRSGDGSVLSVDFSHNNKWIASGTEVGTVCIWNVTSSHPSPQRLRGHSATVSSVVFSSDGSRFASASKDTTARLWNAETGEQLAVVIGHADWVYRIAFSPDGLILASASHDTSVRLWNSITGKAVSEPLEPAGADNIDFSPDGMLIAGGFNDGVVLWQWQTVEMVAKLPADTKPNSVRFSPDGHFLAAASDRGVRLWTLPSNERDTSWVDLGGHSGLVYAATFSPDGLYIASASDDGTIRIWSAGSDQSTVEPLPAHSASVNSVAISFDGAFIVSGSDDRSVRVWDAHTGEAALPPLHGHASRVTSVAISIDGHLIASASTDCTVRLWDARSGAVVGKPITHTSYVTSVAFSRDGLWLVTASLDDVLYVWDITVQQEPALGPLRYRDNAYVVAFSSDGRLLAAGASSGDIHLWDYETGTAAGGSLGHNGSPVFSLALSPDGTRAVSGREDQTAEVWDVAKGQRILALQSHTHFVRSVAWSFDGRFICTGSDDYSVRLWDAMTGALLPLLHGHDGGVNSVAFAPDGSFIVSVSHDSTIRKWDVHAASGLDSEHKNDPFAALASASFEDGWLVGPSGELYLWVPPEYRMYVPSAPCTLQISRSRVVIGVGHSGLHAGSNWTSCWAE